MSAVIVPLAMSVITGITAFLSNSRAAAATNWFASGFCLAIAFSIYAHQFG